MNMTVKSTVYLLSSVSCSSGFTLYKKCTLMVKVAYASGRHRQEDLYEFKISLSYIG